MPFSNLSRRHRLLCGLAALFALLGVLATAVTTQPDLDRERLARLAAEIAIDPETTGAID